MIAFVFPGQGAQKVGMGESLAKTFPICRDVFAEADAALGESLSAMCFPNGAPSRVVVARSIIRSSTCARPAIAASSDR